MIARSKLLGRLRLIQLSYLRPLSAASIDLSLKAAYGLMIRERRRYFRCPVEVRVAILRAAMQTVHGHTVNISEGGLSITTAS